MKQKITHILVKVSYILFALIVAFTLWMFVEITYNEMYTTEITLGEENIILKNLELLDSRGFLVSSILTKELTLTIEGPLAEISRLTSENITLEVDLDNIRTAGTELILYSVIWPSNVNEELLNITDRTTSRIIISIDRPLRKEFMLTAPYTGGTVSDEYMAEDAIIEPRFIEINGPEELISQIAQVVVPIDVVRLSTTYTAELGFLLINEHGETISTESHNAEALTFSQDTVIVTIPLRQVKTVPLMVELIHGVTTSESNTTWYAEPREITIAGDPDDVKNINSWLLGSIDMNTLGTSTSRRLPILLPNNIINISGETESAVQIDVLGMMIEIISVPNIYMGVENVPPGLKFEIVTQTLDIRLRGDEENLAQITPDNIRITADLTDFGTGTSTVNARAYLVGTDADVDVIRPVYNSIPSDYRIAVILSEVSP